MQFTVRSAILYLLSIYGTVPASGVLMTTHEIDELFATTLLGGYDDEEPWEAIRALRHMGTWEVFEKAANWCRADNPLARARGADMLAQLGKIAGHSGNSFPEESYSVIAELVQRETEFQPLNSGLFALGHLDNPLAVPMIIGFASHANNDIRYAVACALGSFPNEPLSVATLLKLVDDADEDVRNWATFGLGNLGDADSSEIRDALIRRLNDSMQDVREEAMVGLGKRKDKRVLPALLGALQQPAMTDMVIDSAYLMLGMAEEPKNWTPADYTCALLQRFSI
jgi:hypothetical protein